MITKAGREDWIPAWFPVLLGAGALGAWYGTVVFMQAGDDLVAIFSGSFAALASYGTLASIAYRRRFLGEGQRHVSNVLLLLLPLAFGAVGVVLFVLAPLSIVRGYGPAFFVLCLLSGVALTITALYFPIEYRRFRKRLTASE